MAQPTTDWTVALREVADHSPFMIWLTDLEGYCFYVNPEWTEFTGQPQDQACGLEWTAMLHPDDRDSAVQALYQAIQIRGKCRIEYRLHRKGDGYRWVEAYGRPHFTAAGDFDGYIGSVSSVGLKPFGKPIELTSREIDVLELIAVGKTSEEIGSILSVSARTVEFHTHSIMLKTNSVNRVQAVVEGIKHGLISL